MKRFEPIIYWTIPLLLFGIITSPLMGQNNDSKPNSVNLKLKPITVVYSTLGGLQYSLDSQPLSTDRDFENLVYPLRDYETTRLLKLSETSEEKGQIFGMTGIIAVAVGVIGLLAKPSNEQTGFWVTAIGGAVCFDLGELFGTESQTAKFNCVQSYNRFARGEEEVLPQGPQDEKSLLNFNGSNNSGIQQ